MVSVFQSYPKIGTTDVQYYQWLTLAAPHLISIKKIPEINAKIRRVLSKIIVSWSKLTLLRAGGGFR
jgi:hypothetical protein